MLPTQCLDSTSPTGWTIFHKTLRHYQCHDVFILHWSSLACPRNCSEHGTCLDNATCSCEVGFGGDACQFELCPNNCSGHPCVLNARGLWTCSCPQAINTIDCSSVTADGQWVEQWNEFVMTSSQSFNPASAASVTTPDGVVYIVGGYNFGSHKLSVFR